ncbi:MAG TPA: hypothetical protein VNO35_21220, partial [Steroidobacteraceae bacterium]|nr:hypothetical protein [Steroidobacteraceae bacterium]
RLFIVKPDRLLATKYSLEELVKAELLRLASLDEDAYPTSVQPAAFRNWLRSDGNLADFVDVVVAYAGNRPDSVAPVVRRLIRHYESLAHGSPAAAQSQIQFVANSLIGQLEISEPGRMALGNPLLRRLAASLDPRSNEEQRQEDRLARVRPFAESLVESGKRSWKMPRFVAPLTLEAYEQNENEGRSTSSAELVASIEKGIPLSLYGEGGIGKTTFTLELAEHCLRSGSRVPIFVDGAAWARANKPLLQYLVERPAALKHAVSVADLTTLACAGQIVLLLNGWNEMPAASKLTCREDLIQLLETAPALSVVTVTRTHTDAPGLARNQNVEVLGLTWKGQSAIIRAELDAKSAAQLVAVLAKNAVLRHAARSPLILRGVIAKARSGITSEATVIDLLGASVAAFEADAQRSHVLNIAPLEGHQARFLEAIGRALTDKTLTSCAREDALKVITETSHQLLVDGLFSAVPSSSAVLDALVNHHLLHAQDDDVRFVHQRFQEYFAAQSLWKTCFNNTDTVRLASAINASAWNEVLFMLAERLRLQSTTPLLRTRLVAAAAAIDLGIACEWRAPVDSPQPTTQFFIAPSLRQSLRSATHPSLPFEHSRRCTKSSQAFPSSLHRCGLSSKIRTANPGRVPTFM